jgi:dTDP-4-dehydrorhamnose reductase
MRVLITGAGGMLGRDVRTAAEAVGHDVVALAHADLDVTDEAAVADAIDTARPRTVINCAAWTDVDGAESAPDQAAAVNGAGAGNLARAAAAAGAWIIHVSSDYVFDGRKREPYVESDQPNPVSAYGDSKLAGELAIAQAAPGRHTVVRSSWLFGAGGQCFPDTILRLASERDTLRVVDDQVGCPTYTGHLAQALLALAAEPPEGILHAAAAGRCSWFEFATDIVDAAGMPTAVTPCTTAEFPRPAARPANSVLRSERGLETVALPEWRRGLREYMSARTVAAS